MVHYNEESDIIAEASTRHVNDFVAKYPDFNLVEEP
jgi:hypothetical protein